MARPSKFNEDICNQLCAYYEEGLPQKTCADLVGIDRMTLHRWLQKGKNARSGKYKDFYLRWCRAKAKFIQHHTNKISDNTSWLAHQYLLQVTDPETYVVAEKQQIEAETKTTLEANVDMNDPRIREDDLALLKALIDDKHGD